MSIRPSVLAGQWYPGDASSLTKTIEGYLAEASPVEYSGDIRAIIVPHAGHTWSGPTAAAAYQLLKGRTYRRIFVLCPNHRVPVYGAVGVSADGFATPLGVVPVDTEMTHQLRDLGLIRLDDGAQTGSRQRRKLLGVVAYISQMDFRNDFLHGIFYAMHRKNVLQ